LGSVDKNSRHISYFFPLGISPTSVEAAPFLAPEADTAATGADKVVAGADDEARRATPADVEARAEA